MNIPDKAFDAADQAGNHSYIMAGAPGDVAKAAVIAAAPFIAAQALRDLASDFPEWAEISNTFHVEDCVDEFNRRADELEEA